MWKYNSKSLSFGSLKKQTNKQTLTMKTHPALRLGNSAQGSETLIGHANKTK